MCKKETQRNCTVLGVFNLPHLFLEGLLEIVKSLVCLNRFCLIVVIGYNWRKPPEVVHFDTIIHFDWKK